MAHVVMPRPGCVGDLENPRGIVVRQPEQDPQSWSQADLAGLLAQASVSSLPAATTTGTPASARLRTAMSSAYWESPPSAMTTTAGGA